MLAKQCMWCHDIYDYVGGKPSDLGASSGVCPACVEKGLTALVGVSQADLAALRARRECAA